MNFNVVCLLAVVACASSYKISTDSTTSSEENYLSLITNQSYDVAPNDLNGKDQIDFQRKSSFSPAAEAAAGGGGASLIDENDVRSEALIKKIHPFVYPKQFNTIDGILPPPNRGFNVTNEHLIEIRDELDNLNHLNNQRLDETLTPPDHKKANTDAVLPWSTHLFDRQPAKHAAQHFHYGFIDRPALSPLQLQHLQHNSILPHANHCLSGLLQGCDPLMLLGILGFVAYVISAVVSLVNRITNLPPLLTSATAAAEMAGTTVNNAPIATTGAAMKASLVPFPNIDEQTVESNQKLLKDFERILQMAIEMYEQKVNSI